MGTQTVGSNGIRKPSSDGLSRQGPLYNLTLNEVQHQLGYLGKPLSSMNLDELLKTVWTADGFTNGPPEYSELAQLDLTKKTIDEVWQDIQLVQKKTKKTKDMIDSGINNTSSVKNQASLGEMTVEDFLVKAGIVAESSQQNLEPQADWMQYQITPMEQQHVFMPGHYQVQQPVVTAYPETHTTMSPSRMMGSISDTHTSGPKRVASGYVMERTMERRQKRMIKNRESAARSRARKQAYTHELESKVSCLEEENERLKREKKKETRGFTTSRMVHNYARGDGLGKK